MIISTIPAKRYLLFQYVAERNKMADENRIQLNRSLAQMLKGGVIMDVTTPEQAHIAEEAGA